MSCLVPSSIPKGCTWSLASFQKDIQPKLYLHFSVNALVITLGYLIHLMLIQKNEQSPLFILKVMMSALRHRNTIQMH